MMRQVIKSSWQIVNTASSSNTFGKRREPHTVIIARGDQVRHFTIQPWIAAILGSLAIACAIGYLIGTSYLMLRDDLIGGSIARQARLQHEYEDRISSLRGQVDRILSRQLLDQQLVETRVTELMSRQEQLSSRYGKLGPLLEKAGNLDPIATGSIPVPTERPKSIENNGKKASLWPKANNNAVASNRNPFSLNKADVLFDKITERLGTIEGKQIAHIQGLTNAAYTKGNKIVDVAESVGYRIGKAEIPAGIGGPFIAGDGELNNDAFVQTIDNLDYALTRLGDIRAKAQFLPFARPVKGQRMTSKFGTRVDPFNKRKAYHSGIDYGGGMGVPIHATGKGKVTKAGWNGGYGRFIEIKHGNGLSTRYAHLNKIKVKKGQVVNSGDVIGLMGSSGRSTGPHLHYEVRKGKKAVNPVRFIEAGKKVVPLLK